MFEISGSLFRGQGAIIIQIGALAVGGWLIGYVAQALGKNQIAQLIHMAMLFVAFTMVVGTLYNAMTAVARVLGI